MQACGIPWGHGIRKQPVNVATGGLHSFLSFSFHFSFHNDYENCSRRPCLHVKFLSITVYGHLTASVLWGKGSASHQLIVWHCLISVLFLAVIAIHCEHSVLLDIVSIQLSYFTRMGLLVKCGLAALRRHLALPPYESSIRVLKVREFVNSIFPVYI